MLSFVKNVVGGMNRGVKAHGRRYLWVRAEISADTDGDISGQKRRYPVLDSFRVKKTK